MSLFHRISNLLLISSMSLVIAIEEFPKCPNNFDITYDSIQKRYICYRLKGIEAFGNKYTNCDGNFFNIDLYRRLDIPKTKHKLWTDFTSLYPNGPFVEKKYSKDKLNIIFNVTKAYDIDETEELCLIIDDKDTNAVNCEDQYRRYCFVKPVEKNIDICDDHYPSWNLFSPKEICLVKITSTGLNWQQAKDLCESKAKRLLSEGWLYVNNGLFTSNIYPVDKVDISEISTGTKDHKLEWALQNGIFIPVVNNVTFKDVLCEKNIKHYIKLNLYVDSKNQIVLNVNENLNVSDIYCYTDSVTYYPLYIEVNPVNDNNKFIFSPMDSGYYWCVYIHPKTSHETVSNQVLFINPGHNVSNLYAIKIKVQEYDEESIDILKYIWKDKLEELISYAIKYEKRDNTDDNIFSDDFRKNMIVNNDAKELIKDFKIKRLYLDKTTVLVHVNLIFEMVPLSVCLWDYMEILRIRPVLHCREKPDELFECVGDFNNGMEWQVRENEEKDIVENVTNSTTESVLGECVDLKALPDVTQKEIKDGSENFSSSDEYSTEIDCTTDTHITPTDDANEITTKFTEITTKSMTDATISITLTESKEWTTITTEAPKETTVDTTTETPTEIHTEKPTETPTETTTDTLTEIPTVTSTETLAETPTVTSTETTREALTETPTETTAVTITETLTQTPTVTTTETTTEITTDTPTDKTTELTIQLTTESKTDATTENITTECNNNNTEPTVTHSITTSVVTTEYTELTTVKDNTAMETVTQSMTTPLLPEDLIQNILNELESFLQEEIVTIDAIRDMLGQVNYLLNLQDISIPGQILQMLAELCARIALEGSPTGLVVEQNIAMLMADSGPENPVLGITVATTDLDGFTDDCFNFYTEFQDNLSAGSSSGVFLPPFVAETDRRISFVMFRDDRAFNTHREFTANSHVISVRVENFSGFGSGEFVNIHTRPVTADPGRNFTRGCGYWEFLEDGSGYWSQYGCTFIKSRDPNTLDICRCDHLTHFAEILIPRTVFSQRNEDALQALSVTGCCISILGLSLIILTSALFHSWRANFCNQIWLQLCISLLVMMICFIIVVFADFDYDSVSCMLIGLMLHYSLLASFCWMLVIAVKSYIDLVLIFSKPLRRKMLVATSFSWGFPLVIIMILISSDPSSYSNRFSDTNPNSDFCYPSGLALWLTVILPVFSVLFVNLVLFGFIVRSIGFAPKNLRYQRAGDKREVLNCARVSVVLVVFFGLPWFSGCFAQNIVAAYIFTLTATTQGFVLFVFIVLGNRETRNLWRLKLRPKKGLDTSSKSVTMFY